MADGEKPDTAGTSRPLWSELDTAVGVVIFWALAGVVFLQFFTRYVLNDSLGWTEEIARYLLVLVTFAGSTFAVRRNTHISVEFLYRFLSRRAARVLVTSVDMLRIGLFGVLTYLCVVLSQGTRQLMTSIDLSKGTLYGAVAACFALMTIYSAVVAIRHARDRKTDVTPDVPGPGMD